MTDLWGRHGNAEEVCLATSGTDRRIGGELRTIGSPAPIEGPCVGLLTSRRTPPDLILPAFDLSRRLRDGGTPVVAGFQSEMERFCLTLLLRGSQPVVVCPARTLEGISIPRAWKAPISEGRLTIASALPRRWRRASAESAAIRNRTLLGLSASLFVIHAAPGSRTFDLAVAALDAGKRVECLPHAENRELTMLGAIASEPLSDPTTHVGHASRS